MDYNTFCTLWHEALTAAGLRLSPVRSRETTDLQTMARAYELYLSFDLDRTRPFYINARLSWQWDALHSARTATTEEDLLVELLGRDGYDLVTKRPWPYHSLLTPEEADDLVDWVENGGGSFLLGNYAPLHHESNPNDVASRFGFHFGNYSATCHSFVTLGTGLSAARREESYFTINNEILRRFAPQNDTLKG